jgi:hypothetical protein
MPGAGVVHHIILELTRKESVFRRNMGTFHFFDAFPTGGGEMSVSLAVRCTAFGD